LFIVAIGIVLLQVAANPYITVLGPAKTASSRLTLIQGVGLYWYHCSTPVGAYFILSRLQVSNAPSEAVRFPYLGIAALLIVIAIVVSRLSLPVIDQAAGPALSSAKEQKAFFFSPFKLWSGWDFMYVGAEVSIGTYLTNYIADTVIHQRY
jgi:FHS family L-fucose permease-like MFS transporter